MPKYKDNGKVGLLIKAWLADPPGEEILERVHPEYRELVEAIEKSEPDGTIFVLSEGKCLT